MAIGRPISLTPNIATKNISSLATADQTEFTVTGGYRINEIAVYRNGVRLAEGRDFTASDGSTVNLVTAASVSDVIEFQVFDSFNVSDAIVSAASSQNLNGDFNVTGSLYAGTFEPGQLVAGIVTASTAFHVGSALTANAAGDVETIGIITAATFSGSGANLTGVASTDNIITGTAATFRNTAVSAGVPNVNIVGLATVGIITAYGTAELSSTLDVTGVANFASAVNVDATTDSTSVSTGALIVDGGAAIAKNVYIGAGLSVAGTLTYEDVTSVDSVGMVTAKSGVNVSGGQLQVGVAYSVGAAGIVTAAGLVLPKDDQSIFVGEGNGSGTGDIQILHTSNNSVIKNTTTGKLSIQNTVDGSVLELLSADDINLGNTSGSLYATFEEDGAASLKYSNSTKLATTNDGTTTTGVSTSSLGFNLPDGAAAAGNASIDVGSSGDFQIWHHTNNHTYFVNNNSSGQLIVGSNITKIMNEAVNETCASFTENGNVELYYDNSKKFESTNDGVSITGICTATDFSGASGGAADFPNGITVTSITTTQNIDVDADSSVRIGDAQNLQLKYTGSEAQIVQMDNSNSLRIKVRDGAETAALFNPTGSVDLYYDDTKKFETTSYGVSIGGSMRDDKGDMRQIPANVQTSAYTLVASDSGKLIDKSGSGAVTIPNNIFGLGDTISILNNSGSNLTITASITTLYNASDAATGNRTLAGRGLATIYFTGGTSAYISGAGLS